MHIFFPIGGDRVTLWCNDIDMSENFFKLNDMANKLKNEKGIIDAIDSWTFEFEQYTRKYNLMDLDPMQPLNKTFFNEVLTQFFFSPNGLKLRYRQKFIFEDGQGNLTDLNCGKAIRKMKLSQIKFQHHLFNGPEEHIPAMDKVNEIVKKAGFTERQVFPTSIGYKSWETDKVISKELYTNLGLALR